MRRLGASRTGGPVRALFRRLIHESPSLLVVGSITAIAQSALLIPIALFVRHLFDAEIPRHHVGSIVLTGAGILALYGASAALGYVARATALRQASQVVLGLRRELLAQLQVLPQAWHDRQRIATVQSITAQDTERVETMLATFAGNVAPAVVVGTALTVAAVIISPLLFATGMVVIPPLMLGGRILARRVAELGEEWSESSRRFSAYSHLMLRALVMTRMAGAEVLTLARASEHARDLSGWQRRLGGAAAMLTAVENATAAAAGTAVLVVGGIAVAHHTMTLGDLLAFYAVLGLLLRALHSLGWQSSAVVVGLQSLHDIESVLAVDDREPYREGERPLQFRGGVSINGVSFAYGDVPVLRELELVVDPGEHVALVGPNGAGKSTLVNLLLGLYAPDAGFLCADGVRYEELDIRSLRRQMGVVLQDPVLLPGTIRENIAFAAPDATDSAIRAAAAAATADDFIRELPAGYDTPIGDEGTGLSGGERQRIAIARALLGTPVLLVLDEPSTFLDDASVTTLMEQLMSLSQAPTVLLVTHDPEVHGFVDRVVELRDGQIVRDSRRQPRLGAAHAG